MRKIIYIFIAFALYACNEEGGISATNPKLIQSRVISNLSVESIVSTFDTSRVAGVICLKKYIDNYTLDTALNAELVKNTSESAYAYFANEARNGLYAEPSIKINGYSLKEDDDSKGYYSINKETGVNDFRVFQGDSPNIISKSNSVLNPEFNFNISFSGNVKFLNLTPNQRVNSNSDFYLNWENNSQNAYFEINITGSQTDTNGIQVLKYHTTYIEENNNSITISKTILKELLNMNARIEIIKYEPKVLTINNGTKDIIVISCSKYNTSFVVN